jgi:PAS domain S-box-containing protein
MALANSPIVVFEQDLELRYTWIHNPKLGYAACEVIGKRDDDLLEPDCAARLMEVKRRVIETGAPIRREVTLAAPGGPIETYDLSVEPLRDETGRIVGVVCAAADVTQRRQADEARRRSEERFRLLVEQAVDGIFLSDAAGRYVDVNSAGHAMLGYTREEILCLGIVDVLAPEDVGRFSVALSERAAGQATRTEWRFRRKDGSEFVGEVVGRQLPDGQLLGILRDVTERKQNEERLRRSESLMRLAADAARMTYAELDFKTGDLRLADNYARVMGFPLPSISLEGNLAHLDSEFLCHVAPEDRERLQAANRAFVKGDFDGCITYRVKAEDGGERWIEGRWTVEADENGLPSRGVASSLDITERKRAEIALRENQQRSQLATEATGVGIWEWNAGNGDIRWDRQMFAIYGAPPTPEGYFNYDSWAAMVLPEDLVEQEILSKKYAGERGVHRREFRIRRPDNGEIRILQSVETIRADAAGETEWVIGTNLDVTERRCAEQRLADSETRFRLAQEASLDTFLIYEPIKDGDGKTVDLKVVYINKLGANYCRSTPEQMQGRPISEALPGAIRPGGLIERHNRTLASGGSREYILDYESDGIRGHFRNLIAPFGRYAAASFRDITAQVEGVRALEAAKRNAEEILSSIADGFYALDSEWRFVYFNQRAEVLLSRSRDEVLGRSIFEVSPQFRDTPLEGHFRAAIQEKRSVDFQCVAPTLKRWVAFSISPTSEGGVSVHFRDISEQKAMEAELLAAKAEAERANNAKSKFLAAASHDLRQPVQSLVLLLSLLERQVVGESKAVETARLMRAAVEGLYGLLTSVLDVSRLDAGVVKPAAVCLDLGALVLRLSEEYTPKAAEKGLALRQFPRGLQARVDPALLERALRNLIENALRYTCKGGVLLAVRRRGERVRIDVIDTGVGIPEDMQAEIFEEFHQLNNPGRNLEQGLGLGLAIVARLADLLDAKVEVASRVGRGSRFSLSLPLVQEAASFVPDPPAFTDPGGRLLIIEDNVLVRDGLEAALRPFGYETLAADRGEAALDLAAREGWRFDAIVADHRLGPGRTGIETAREIHRRAGRFIATLVLTGDTDSERIAEIEASGFAFLHKPVDAQELRRQLARQMGAGAPQPPACK